MPHSGETMVASLFVFSLICMQSQSMLYQEPINIEDIYDIFNDNGCIEGSLSITENGSPLINPTFSNQVLISNDKETSNLLDEKSPLSLISELATFNKIQYVYNLTQEQGPSHKKTFGIYLELGNERYYAEGNSIKKAQKEAAKLALNSTLYAHPTQSPIKDKSNTQIKNPVERLYSWANKRSVSISYLFNEPSFDKKHSNHHHKNMYSKNENIYIATVKIGNHEFVGEGNTLEESKQNAASAALKGLQNVEGFCIFDNSEKSLINKLFNSDNENSPVSLVYEFSSKTKMPLSFNLISEEGPAHIKNFVYKCNIGEKYESSGEGSSKKAAKAEAAQNMINHLKSLVPYSSEECKDIIKKKKRNKRSNLIKNVEQITDDDDNARIYIADNIDPISKLIQIQQANHDIVPTFNLKEESGQSSKEFFIEVVIGEHSYIGSGHNKKIAKRKAAEGMLELMGYSITDGKTRLSSSAKKKKAFLGNSNKLKQKPILLGFNIGPTYFNSEEFSQINNQPSNAQSEPVNNKYIKDNSFTTANDNVNILSEKKVKDKIEGSKTERKTHVDSKKELAQFAQQLGIKFQFSDFPKMKDSGFVSLLSLTTSPPSVCFGNGLTNEISRDQAALNALDYLYKNELDSISKILRASPSIATENDDLNVDEKVIIENIIVKDNE